MKKRQLETDGKKYGRGRQRETDAGAFEWMGASCVWSPGLFCCTVGDEEWQLGGLSQPLMKLPLRPPSSGWLRRPERLDSHRCLLRLLTLRQRPSGLLCVGFFHWAAGGVAMRTWQLKDVLTVFVKMSSDWSIPESFSEVKAAKVWRWIWPLAVLMRPDRPHLLPTVRCPEWRKWRRGVQEQMSPWQWGGTWR